MASNHAVVVFIESLEGIPLVKDPTKPEPHYWELPGGHDEEGETPIQTGWRELQEKTGLTVLIKTLLVRCQKYKRNHVLYLVHGFVLELEGLAE